MSTQEQTTDEFKHTYLMLSRLETDLKFFFGYGNRSPHCLFYGNFEEHIKGMKDFHNSLPEDKKPEWLSMDDIENYEKMIAE